MALGTLCIIIVFLDHSYFISSVFLVLYLFWYVVVASIIVSCCNFLWLFSTNKNLNISVMLLLSIVLNSICIFHLNTITSFSQSYLWPYLRMTSFSKYQCKYTKHCLNSCFCRKDYITNILLWFIKIRKNIKRINSNPTSANRSKSCQINALG